MCHYTFAQTHRIRATPRVNPNVNSGRSVMMTGQCRFISCNKCIIRWGVPIVQEAVHIRGVGRHRGIWEFSVPSVQYCSEPNTTLKNKVYCLKVLKTHLSTLSGSTWTTWLPPSQGHKFSSPVLDTKEFRSSALTCPHCKGGDPWDRSVLPIEFQ